MLGGADNPNGELLSYIIGADSHKRFQKRGRGVLKGGCGLCFCFRNNIHQTGVWQSLMFLYVRGIRPECLSRKGY